MVAGAGPAGLQAAIAAARNGHRVTVYEQAAQAGGQLRLAATVPNRAELGDMVRNQLTECRRHGVQIHYGQAVWPGLVDELRPDKVIVATGAEPQRPWWAPADVPNVADVRAVIEGTARPEGDVVVIDEIGFHHATSVAELLADRGCAVEIVTNGMVVGQDLGITLDMENWWMRATAKGIVQSTDLVPMGVAGGDDDRLSLTLLHHPTGANQVRTPHWVVLAVPAAPVEWLYVDLERAGVDVERVGDCVAPRRAHAAVVDGEARRQRDLTIDGSLRLRCAAGPVRPSTRPTPPRPPAVMGTTAVARAAASSPARRVSTMRGNKRAQNTATVGVGDRHHRSTRAGGMRERREVDQHHGGSGHHCGSGHHRRRHDRGERRHHGRRGNDRGEQAIHRRGHDVCRRIDSGDRLDRQAPD